MQKVTPARIDDIEEFTAELGNVVENSYEDETMNHDDFDEYAVFRFVERKPPEEFVGSGKKPDNVYIVQKLSEYELALRK